MAGSSLVKAEELSEIVRANDLIYSTPNPFAPYYAGTEFAGFQPDDSCAVEDVVIDSDNQICIVPGGVVVADLQSRLGEVGLGLPLPLIDGLVGGEARLTVRQALDLNLPHALEAQFGNWRDWVIGMTVALGDGTVAKSGSQAVKNVAGYDAHKLFIGAKGTLGIVAEVILRVRPVGVRIEPEVLVGGCWAGVPVIHRVLASDFDAAMEEGFWVADQASSTLWRDPAVEFRRFGSDWVMRAGEGLERNALTSYLERNALTSYLERAKREMDPDGKLNRGLLGIF